MCGQEDFSSSRNQALLCAVPLGFEVALGPLVPSEGAGKFSGPRTPPVLGSHLSTSRGVCHSLGTSEPVLTAFPCTACPDKGFPKDFQTNLRQLSRMLDCVTSQQTPAELVREALPLQKEALSVPVGPSSPRVF